MVETKFTPEAIIEVMTYHIKHDIMKPHLIFEVALKNILNVCWPSALVHS